MVFDEIPLYEGERGLTITPMATGNAEVVCQLLTAFFGKLVQSHGYVFRGASAFAPDFTIDIVPHFKSFPFNDNARAATGIELNHAQARELLKAYFGEENADAWSAVLPACAFYHAALQHFGRDTAISYVLLLSALECLARLHEITDEELYGDLWPRLCEVRKTMGDAVFNDLRGRLRQLSHRCASMVDSTLNDRFFDNTECSPDLPVAMRRENVQKHIKASYSLRSTFLHAGKEFGGWVGHVDPYGAEVLLGEPVVHDKDLKKALMTALTITGLERVVQFVLFRRVQSIYRPAANQ